MAADSARDAALSLSPSAPSPSPSRSALHAEDICDWLLGRRAGALSADKVLTAIRSVQQLVPLGGQSAGSGALQAALRVQIPAHDAAEIPPEEWFYKLALACCALPTSVPRDLQLKTLEALVKQAQIAVPTDMEDIPAWWSAVHAVREAYFAARRAFFRVRIHILRLAAFDAAGGSGMDAPWHPHAACIQQVATQLCRDGLVSALIEELEGRARLVVPNLYEFARSPVPSPQRYLRAAQHQWEAQVMEEEMLLRELLLLALHFSKENVPIAMCTKLIEQLLAWPVAVVPELFSQYSLSLPLFHSKLRRVKALGAMLAMCLLHGCCLHRGIENEWRLIAQWTHEYVLAEAWKQDIDTQHEQLLAPNAESSAVMIGWATLLAKLYRRSTGAGVDRDQLENDLQGLVRSVEAANAFHHLSSVLRSLVFNEDCGATFPFVCDTSRRGFDEAVMLGRQAQSTQRISARQIPPGFQVAAFQVVSAAFLDDALSTLRYVDNLEDSSPLNDLVMLLIPALCNSRIADQMLQHRSRVIPEPEFGSAITTIYDACRQHLPQDPLPYLRIMTALCSTAFSASSTKASALVGLREFAVQHEISTPSVTLQDWRLLPPDEYLEYVDGEAYDVVCRQAFAYPDDQLLIRVGTRGVVDTGNDSHVQWQIPRPKSHQALWDTSLQVLETIVTKLQSQSLLELDGDTLDTLTSLFEWIAQVSDSDDGIIAQIGQQWAQARVRQWWRDMQLPLADELPVLLANNKVSLTMLLSASMEDLAAWGIRDQFTRDQILASIASQSASSPLTSLAHTSDALERDGLVHLIRMMMGFLDGFVHASGVSTSERAGVDALTKPMHFISCVLVVLQKFAAVPLSLKILIDELGGNNEECVTLVVQSAKKLFTMHENVVGEYPGVFATLTILHNTCEWFSAKEVCSVLDADSSGIGHPNSEFTQAERSWLVATVEFVLELVATQDAWIFQRVSDKNMLLSRCFRILSRLLSAGCYGAASTMRVDFQSALRDAIRNDATLVAKLLRSCCRLLASCGDSSVSIAGVPRDEASEFPLARPQRSKLLPFEFVADHASTSNDISREHLVAAGLQLVLCLMEHDHRKSGAFGSNISIVLQPIEGSSYYSGENISLAVLCGGYVAYPASKHAAISYCSLKILQLAAKEMRSDPEVLDDAESRSLVTLFSTTEDFACLRDFILGILKTPGTSEATKCEAVRLLTLTLEYQPAFFAVLLMDAPATDATGTRDDGTKTKRLVTMVEHFLLQSEQQLEQGTELLCCVLSFVRQIWHGGVKEGHTLPLEIAEALRQSTDFWQNLTHALRVRLPLDTYSTEAMDVDMSADHPIGRACIGRVGTYASLVRGLALEIVSYECHYCNRQPSASDHGFSALMESFRQEGLFGHWLRTFPRLHYAPLRFFQATSPIQQLCPKFEFAVIDKNDSSTVLTFHDAVLASLNELQRLLAPRAEQDAVAHQVLQIARSSFVQLVQVTTEMFAMAKWRVFMELRSLQDSSNESAPSTGSTSSGSTTPLTNSPRRLKRKESMIMTPPRVQRSIPSSPSEHASSASNFSGDRTSYGMIQVLSDVMTQEQQRQLMQAGAPMDFFQLVHLRHLMTLFVSMLHHQFCIVVHKTNDPKMSQIRPRELIDGSRITISKSFELLQLVEETIRQVHLATKQFGCASRELKGMMGSMDAAPRSLWRHLVEAFDKEVCALEVELRSLILTAALLLCRQIATHRDTPATSSRPQTLQVKLVEHAITSIKRCDGEHPGASRDQVNELFQVSWNLLLVLLDEFGMVVRNAMPHLRLEPLASLQPLVLLLQHEKHGLRALLRILAARFHPHPSTSSEEQTQACTVLKGLSTIVWSPDHRELCRHVMLNDAQGLSIIRFAAVELVPAVSKMIQAEASRDHAVRGYCRQEGTKDRSYVRCVAHQAWCAILDVVAGLIRQLRADDPATSVWEFLSSAEKLLIDAMNPSMRLTEALVEEQRKVLRLFRELSVSSWRRKHWREMFPTSFVLLLEECRLTLRRTCVLLGNSSYGSSRKREQQHQLQLQKRSSQRLSVTAWPLQHSPRSSMKFAHQTLLHEHLQPIGDSESLHLSAFYKRMEGGLVAVVREAAMLLLEWTQDVISPEVTVSLHGARFVDTERLTPLLACIPPNDSLSMSCEPSLGQLCLVMDFILEHLKTPSQDQEGEESIAQPPLDVFTSTFDVCGLLLFKTLLLHLDQRERPPEHVRDAFQTFFERITQQVDHARSDGDESPDRTAMARLDGEVLQLVVKVLQAGQDADST